MIIVTVRFDILIQKKSFNFYLIETPTVYNLIF